MSEEEEKNRVIKISIDEEKSTAVKMSEDQDNKIEKMHEIEEKSQVIRIVNLDAKTNEKSLREFITAIAHPNGQIEKLFIRRNLRSGVYYAYIVLQLSEDATKICDLLNGYMHNQLKLEDELIGPRLKYKFYDNRKETNTNETKEKLFGKRNLNDGLINGDLKIHKKVKIHYDYNSHVPQGIRKSFNKRFAYGNYRQS